MDSKELKTIDYKKIITKQNVQSYLVLNHFSNIFSNMSFVITIFCFLVIASFFIAWGISVMLVLILGAVFVFITLVTFGVIYVVTDFVSAWKFLGDILNNTEKFSDFIGSIYKYIPYLSMFGMVLSILSIIMLSFSQNEHKVAKIVWLSICIFVLLFCVVMGFAYKGGIKWII